MEIFEAPVATALVLALLSLFGPNTLIHPRVYMGCAGPASQRLPSPLVRAIAKALLAETTAEHVNRPRLQSDVSRHLRQL